MIQSVLRHKSARTTEKYLKSLGLEKVRKALEDLSKQKGRVLELKPKEKEGEKATRKTKSRRGSRHLPRRHLLKLGW